VRPMIANGDGSGARVLPRGLVAAAMTLSSQRHGGGVAAEAPRQAAPSGNGPGWSIGSARVSKQQPSVKGSDGCQLRCGNGSWRSCLVDNLATGDGSLTDEVFGRWARKAESLATCHVRKAFEDKLRGHLRSAAAASAGGGQDVVPFVLALAGSDISDHESTMRQVAELVGREALSPGDSLPPCTALLGPGDLRTPVAAARRICQELTREAGSGGGQEGGVVPLVEDEEDEGGEEVAYAGGARVFAEWYRRRGAGRLCVLLLSQVESISKDVLRQVLDEWGCDDGAHAPVPLFIVLGMQQPPQGRFELFESESLTTLVNVGAVRLLNASAICNDLLEHLAQDVGCPVALTPDVLSWLRDSMRFSSHSISHILKALAMLCSKFFATRPLAGLCAALKVDGAAEGAIAKLSSDQLESIFAKLLRANSGLLANLRELWPDVSERGLMKQTLQAAASAVLWRRNLAASLPVWDVILCTLRPMVKHQGLLWRMCRLLDALWPQWAAAGPATEAAIAKERQAARSLLEKCLGDLGAKPIPTGAAVGSEGTLGREGLDGLVRELAAASGALESEHQELSRLADAELSDAELRESLQTLLRGMLEKYWQPLDGPARELFLAAFACGGHQLKGKVERSLGWRTNFVEEMLLQPLACHEAGDAGLLYRILEGCQGRAVSKEDLWRAFEEHAAGGSESTLATQEKGAKRRFGAGLVALHSLGLLWPRANAGFGRAGKVAGWRLHKRHFGRTWLKAPKQDTSKASQAWAQVAPPTFSPVEAAAAAAPPPESSDPDCVVVEPGPVAKGGTPAAPMTPPAQSLPDSSELATPARAVAPSLAMPRLATPVSHLKRRPTFEQPVPESGKRLRAAPSRATRVFMG